MGWRRQIVKVSTTLQYSAAKFSIFYSGITLATVLSMRFNLDWLVTVCIVAAGGLMFAGLVFVSGVLRNEYEYAQELNDVRPRLERIEKMLERMKKE